METKVLITGAAGPSGSNATKRLLELNVPVRAMVRKLDDRSAELSNLGAEVVVGDMTNFNSVSQAMKGISSVLFVYPVAEGLVQATAYLIQAAVEENVQHIVNISQRTAVRDAISHSAQDHWLAERLLDHAGIPVTHLQPTLFMEWLIYFAQEIKENNRFISPFGEARYGMINSEDIGRSAAAILANPEGHAGKTYNIYGPSEVTGQEIVETLSTILKREISYAPIEPDAFGEILKSFGAPDYQTRHIVAAAKMFQSGEFRGMTDNVEKLTGTKPLSVADFINKNIALF
ncbi:NmrA family NAD(P)-binding protein [Mucilaginibacter aquaedulcis]|uniref:NmrA family NAD(P)-binding protein n=1 Tax=Mucilaginibacter aquaedulcis TaxID=1187081 RepID=UPI0025B44894|nr:NmrA family NAD(P)-binding protein [Mucilaginibacter aquaedulcis]MDN3548853.1 NmrA family NAD(P)-binding protein [Mucilaginibacter aquaedulcis]